MDNSLYKERHWDINSTGSLRNYQTLSESVNMPVEPSPLPEPQIPPIWIRLIKRYCATNKFIESKAAILILVWILILGVLFWGDHLYTSVYIVHQDLRYFPAIYLLNGIPFCLYPLAGMLADNKYGRYKTIMGSLYLLLAIATICSIASTIIVPLFHMKKLPEIDGYISTIVFFFLSSPGSIGFFANNIPFGLDQLYEAPGDHQSLFIHWVIWVTFLAIFINSASWSLYTITPTHLVGIGTRVAIPILATCALAFTMYLTRRNWRWFLKDSAKISPYNLVYQVTKFAREHKTPLQRSAFTYHEDELPAGLNLGKQKYGGPFTTEQVEDVKVFYGILKILFCAAFYFLTDIAANPNLFIFARHAIWTDDDKNETTIQPEDYILKYLVRDGLMTSLLIVICLPLYICFLRPFIVYKRLGMLRRIGLAMILQLLSIVLTLAMDTFYHHRTGSKKCMFYDLEEDADDLPEDEYFPFLDVRILIVQRSLVAFSYMLFQIAIFEFICSQSPRSMVGMLFGLGFAIRGVNNVVGSIIIFPLHALSKKLNQHCGLVYYLFNILVGVMALALFVFAARKYRERTRDERCDYYRYAEDYFSNLPKKATLKKI